jgi:DNA-binding NtrC family response regulator
VILEKSLGAVVTTASDCEKARDFLRTSTFDLVAVRHCRSAANEHDMMAGTLSEIASTPFIAVTDEDDWEAATTALESGASGYVENGSRLRSGLASAAVVAMENASLNDTCEEEKRALKESEELYRTIVEMSPDAILVTDIEANITNISRKTLDMFRCEDPDEMVGRSGFEFFVPEDLERASTNFQRRFVKS